MNRKLKFFIATASMLCSMAMTSLAGQWIESNGQWFYMTDDANFAKNTWLWLDENHDTHAELYHFDANGVMSQGTTVGIVDGSENIQINIDGNGAATDYILTYTYSLNKTKTNHSAVKKVSLPPSYSINLDADGNYVYSSNVDHYDFKEICDAWISSIKDCGDYYSADCYLVVYHDGSDPGVFGNFEFDVKTTAKFSKDCKVKNYPNDIDSSAVSISKFLKTNDYFNMLYAEKVNSDGYITLCSLSAVE